MLAELRPSRLSAALALLLALSVASCGSGEEGATVDTIAKAQFIKRALAICGQANDEIGRVYTRYAEPPYPGGRRPTSERMNEVAEEVVIPARRKEVRRIRALGFPPGEARRVEAILEAIEEGIAEGERDRRTLRADGVPYAFARALKLQGEYGLGECAVS